MASPITLPLNLIVDVVVLVSPQAPPLPTFNQGLIIGSSTVIPSWGTNYRIRQYSSLNGMLSDGFSLTSPEYIAASLYFGQSPPPQLLWVGRQDLTGSTVQTAVPHTGAQGTGYAVGDYLTVTGGGGSSCILKVTTVGGSGNVTGVVILQDGTGYATTSGATTTTNGVGVACTVDITAGNESAIEAAQYCRSLNSSFYGVYVIGAVATDHQLLAQWAQSAQPPTMYFYNTADSAVLNNLPGNIFAALKASNYNRAIGFYSTTQGGLYPNNLYTSAGVMGVAFGLNTGLANSYFTLMFKQIIGVAWEPLTQSQVATIAGNPGQGTGLNGNVFVDYANSYTLIQQGVLASGQFFDEILQLDMLSADIQISLMNLLVANASIPQTDQGQVILMHAVNQAANRAVARGYIASGTWEGVQVLNLSAGDPMPSGYVTQSPPYSQQSTSDKQARKSMPIYLAINEAGAVQSILVGVYVQR